MVIRLVQKLFSLVRGISTKNAVLVGAAYLAGMLIADAVTGESQTKVLLIQILIYPEMVLAHLALSRVLKHFNLGAEYVAQPQST